MFPGPSVRRGSPIYLLHHTTTSVPCQCKMQEHIIHHLQQSDVVEQVAAARYSRRGAFEIVHGTAAVEPAGVAVEIGFSVESGRVGHTGWKEGKGYPGIPYIYIYIFAVNRYR